MKNLENLTNIIESIIFVSGEPIAIKDIAEKLEITDKEITACIEKLNKKYSGDSGVNLLQFNNKLQFCSNPKYANDVASVLNPIKEKELSRSMLEAIAIIAYKQPVTRIDLEEIRGVNSEYCIQKLLELNMIEPVGRKDAVGRPVLFGTTDNFLKRFQISSLSDLPDYDELIERITSLHAGEVNDDYLYRKDEYIEKEEEVAVTTVTTENTTKDKKKTDNHSNTVSDVDNDDFELPSLEDEELPDFLQGEDVEKF